MHLPFAVPVKSHIFSIGTHWPIVPNVRMIWKTMTTPIVHFESFSNVGRTAILR